MRVALLVPAPDYGEDHSWAFDVQAQVLRDAGAVVEALRWTDAADLDGFDLVSPLVAWGYHRRYGEWLSLLEALERRRTPVLNPVPLLRWNSDKIYLAELGEAGIPTIPTIAVESLDDEGLASACENFGTQELVIKPPVSAGADGTYRLRGGEGVPGEVRGRRMIVQPWIPSVQSVGEYSLMFFGGEYSHSVVKRPADGDFRVQPHLGGRTEACAPPAGALELARCALAAAPAEAVYARVDIIPGASGKLRIMELELIEPALFLDLAPGSGERFAAAFLSAAKRLGKEPLPQG